MRDKKRKKKIMNMQDIKIEHLILEKIENNDLYKKEGRFQSPEKIVKILKRKTALKYSKSFPKIDKFFMYHPGVGIYLEFSNNELIVLVNKIFRYSNIDYPSLILSESICKHIRLAHDALFGEPIYEKRYIVFTNCLYNLQTNQVGEWTPEIFLTTSLPIPFIRDAQCPKFLTFLKEFSNGYEDRVCYLRAWMWAILTSWTEGQVLLYIMGPGSTGKSQFVSILTSLIGKNKTITTTLKDLHTDRFEASNLLGKQLCIINDIENYKGDMSVIKQLVGGDSIRGRLKNVNAALEIHPECMVVIVGNFPLGSRDTSGALGRRVRVFQAENVSEKRENLLSYNPQGTWKGSLADELSGILIWVLSQNKDRESREEAKKYLTNSSEMVPSLRLINEETLENLNPLSSWIKDEIEPGEGAFVGFTMKRDLKGDLEVQRRRTLYPTYKMWADRREIKSIGHRTFTSGLLMALKKEGYLNVNKVRRMEGIFIEGIRIRDHAYDRDHIFGSSLDLKIPESQIQPPKSPESQIQLPEKMSYQPPEKGKQHPVLTPKIYVNYQSLLGSTPRKVHLNKEIRSYFSSESKKIEEKLKLVYFEGKEKLSEAYIESFLKVLRRGIKSLANFGVIPYSYKQMGVSPRIYPLSFGNTVNHVKRLIRDEAYSYLGQQHDTNIVDFDLKSCFTSILLGLYPRELKVLQHAIETTGLWDYIKQEFIQENKLEWYNKSSVKICVYSSFFQGGGNAMIQGMIAEHQKNLGLTPKEFRELPDYETFYESSRIIAEVMQNSSVILDFRKISGDMKNAYLGDALIGPTGHNYIVTEETFPSAYSNYLQSFEFALLAETTIQLVRENPNIEVIGHFHDGNVLLIPESDLAETKIQFQAKLKKLGYLLGLAYEQKIEVKNEWPGSK